MAGLEGARRGGDEEGGRRLATPTVEDLRWVPKAELHLHLDGSVRAATVEELARARGVIPADAPAGAAMARVRVTRRAGLLEALAGFEILLPLLQTPDDLARVTRELVEDLAADGVVYAELRFCPRLNTELGMDCDQALGVAAEAAAEAEAATGTRARLIACLMGGVPPEWNDPVVDAAIRRRADGVVAVDLAGVVTGRDAAWIDATARQFARARDAGMRITVHAGEAEPPSAIRTALDRYGATRIGHTTSPVDDPDLLAEVVERGVTLEVCPRSNYWTRTPAEMPRLADHPVGRLLAAGARACLNTDDRSLFGNDLSSELAEVAAAQGFGDQEVAALIANGFRGAFDADRAAEALGAATGEA
jgi:adenosine deaminase